MIVQGTLFGKGDDGGWTECECTSYSEVYEHNNECRALEVTGQDVPLPRGLGAWRELP